MRYLVLEFSTENLLFVVELIMVKHRYQQQNNNIVKIPRHNTVLLAFKESKYSHLMTPTTTHTKSKAIPTFASLPKMGTPTMEKIASNENAFDIEVDVNLELEDIKTPDSVQDTVASPIPPAVTPASPASPVSHMTVCTMTGTTLNMNMMKEDDEEDIPPPINPQLLNQVSANDNSKYMIVDFNITADELNILSDVCTDLEVIKEKPSMKKIGSKSNKHMTSLSASIIFNDDDDDHRNMNEFGPLGTYIFDDNGNIIVKLFIPRELPLSAISSINTGLYSKMLGLFNKYIRNNATHELNISSDLRTSLTKFFANEDLRIYYTKNEEGQEKDYKLFNLLDGCCMEILRLMNDSFTRFQSTKAYHDVYNEDIGMFLCLHCSLYF